MSRPVTRQRLDRIGGDPAFLRRPLRGLGHAVLPAEHVVRPVGEADRMRVEVIRIEGTLGQPDVRDGELQCGVGIGQHRYPLVRVRRVRVVHIRGDVNLLDAHLGEELLRTCGHLATPSERRSLGVAAPEEHRLAVAICLHIDCRHPVLLDDALHLARDDIERLVPADAHVRALAPCLRMPFPIRIPVNALHRVENTVLRVHALFVCGLNRRIGRPRSRVEHMATDLDLPGMEPVHWPRLVKMVRAYADDSVLFRINIDIADVRTEARRAEPKALVHGLAPCIHASQPRFQSQSLPYELLAK